ncbi:hypothetical protein FHG64_17840 [Antarcticibacterium flavum]|uniref:DUF3761 domain-containing protein n=1 Tax=Antarcticibacterium flavum TaxID=2058175 RepID=A0A5B7X6Q7_9FLAO|nr:MULTISPECIES: hypothetical protein [Antarcticibacterium]MCM4160884.1 hypothetical protein [Antarcticibacterium sp. W02-3]QCY71107.1 hypothetical protein FHG64_17840 [Antarcticibacterium flavum]
MDTLFGIFILFVCPILFLYLYAKAGRFRWLFYVAFFAGVIWLFNSLEPVDTHLESQSSQKVEEKSTSFNKKSEFKNQLNKELIPIDKPSTFRTSQPKLNNNFYKSDTKVRVGAVCNDGTTSQATGSGACSHHGGVAYWLYE